MEITLTPIASATHCPRCKGPVDETTIAAKRCDDCGTLYHASCLGVPINHPPAAEPKLATCCSFACNPLGGAGAEEETTEGSLWVEINGERLVVEDVQQRGPMQLLQMENGEEWVCADAVNLQDHAQEVIESDFEMYMSKDTLAGWAVECIAGGQSAASQFDDYIQSLEMYELIGFYGSWDDEACDLDDYSQAFDEEYETAWDVVFRVR